ncbi:MAG: hypothetical protein J6C97_02655, partial [Clostridia bacterium]|nr:hypothetical protein [Clostridia bacterium]
MKNRAISLLISIIMLFSLFCIDACSGSNTEPTIPDYNADIVEVVPENITTEHFVVQEETVYYTSPGFSLVISVNGEFMVMDYFYLDGNCRVYDNLYFYVDDYYYIVTDDYKDLYASLGDSADLQYAEEEKESGYDIQINIKKSGKYKLIFNLDTLKFDMVYLEEIVEPIYYTIKSCAILKVKDREWIDLSLNPQNENEFYIANLNIE